MSRVMIFSANGTKVLPDPPYLTQLVGAKLANASGATLAKIYDGVDATGALRWELQVSAAGLVDYNDMSPDGVIFESGNVFVHFDTGGGDVLLLVK